MNWVREVRRSVCVVRRRLGDWLTGRPARFVRSDAANREAGQSFPVRFSVTQPILQTEHVEAKLHNLRLAIQIADNLVVPPDGVFSFCHLIGRPSRNRGFRAGRSLLGGRLAADYGGGLCQLSGIIYHTVLLAGLEVLERHAHSVDIYDEHARHTPLGADATVAFGFKDLRFANSLASPVCLRFGVGTAEIVCSLCSPAEITLRNVRFVRVCETADERVVETRCQRPGETGEVVTTVSRYRRPRTGAQWA